MKENDDDPEDQSACRTAEDGLPLQSLHLQELQLLNAEGAAPAGAAPARFGVADAAARD